VQVGERETVEMARASTARSSSSSIALESLTLIGRAESTCGLRGTSAKAGTVGCRIGPCAESA